MKALVIGASGTIGSAVVRELEKDTTLITAGSKSGDHQVDLGDSASIAALFKAIGPIDAVVVTAARGIEFKHLTNMTTEDYQNSLKLKLFGQINVALEAMKVLNDNGSITLTTGILSHDFVTKGSAAATINGGIDAFVQAAALEMPRGIRINAVSPALLEESAEGYASIFTGFEPVSSAKVGRAFRKSIYGIQTGRVYHVT